MNTNSKPVALVAGGTSGIGLAITHKLVDKNYDVIVAARNVDKLNALKNTFLDADQKITTIQCNVDDASNVESTFKQIKTDFDRLDALVNSVGISYVAPVAMAKLDRCQEVLQTNLMGAYFLSKSAIRIMSRQRHGRIVHIGSISGEIGRPYNAIYAASKAGLGGLVKSLALEVSSIGITVNMVQPGTVYTDMFEETHSVIAKLKGLSIEEIKTEVEQENPQKRLTSVDDVAASTAFLLSDGAAGINGHSLRVDGGRSVA